ncbi:MAG: (2Fe-2S)-binding protein [Syntrophorhabdaceae bacterium]|nr:(2Fe-2S)-binding protein [Syntrophorhabdaceae bacterium]
MSADNKRGKNREIIKLNVNGTDYHVLVEHRETLLEVLREKLQLTGTKDACNQGECGACTVLLDGRPVLACLVLAMEVRKKKITTIEGLAKDGGLTPIQESFIKYGAIQCGFCSPGMILTTTALLAENPKPTRRQIKKAIEGNICGCTGYNKIIEAIEAVRDKNMDEGS